MHVYFKIASLSEPDTFIPILMHILYRNILFSLNCLLFTLTDSEQKICSTEQSFEINKHLEKIKSRSLYDPNCKKKFGHYVKWK